MTMKYESEKSASVMSKFHDSGEQTEAEVSRYRQIMQNVVAALNNTFFISIYVNLRSHKFIILFVCKTNAYIRL